MNLKLAIMLVMLHISFQANSSEVFYLLTKFESSEFIKNKSYLTKDGNTVLVPGTLAMKFNVVKTLESGSDFGNETITVPMDIETDYPFRISDGIVLVVKKSSTDKLELLDWDFISKTFCVNKKLVPQGSSELYFDAPWKPKEKCRFIK